MTETHLIKLYGVICAMLRTKNARHSQHLTKDNASWRLNVEQSGQISNAPGFVSIYTYENICFLNEFIVEHSMKYIYL